MERIFALHLPFAFFLLLLLLLLHFILFILFYFLFWWCGARNLGRQEELRHGQAAAPLRVRYLPDAAQHQVLQAGGAEEQHGIGGS